MSSTGPESTQNAKTTAIAVVSQGKEEDADLSSRKRSRDQVTHSSNKSTHRPIAENGEELCLKRQSPGTAVTVAHAGEETECQRQRQRPRCATLEPSSDDGLSMGSSDHNSSSAESSAQKMTWLKNHRKKAAACEEEGDLMFARDLLQESLQVAVQAFQEGVCGASCLGQHLAEMANVCYRLGDTAEAIDYYTNSIKHERMALTHKLCQSPRAELQGCHCHLLLQSLKAVCRIYVEVQQYPSALCVYKEIYDIELEMIGPNSLEVASTLCDMGLLHYMLQLYKPSLHFYQEALRISITMLEGFKTEESDNVDTARRCLPPPVPSLALEKRIGDYLNATGILYFKLGRLNAATSAFKSSLMIREKVLGFYHRDVTIIWYNLAKVCVESGDEYGAIPLYQEGLRRDRIGLGDDFHSDLSPTLQYLGEVHHQLGELDDSLLCYEQALQIECRAALRLVMAINGTRRQMLLCDAHLVSICRLLNLIGNVHLMQADISGAMSCFVQAVRVAARLTAWGSPHNPMVVAGHLLCHLTRLHPRTAAAA